MPTLTTVGWREYVSLPALGLDGLKAKVDTGARTSALHAFRTELEARDDGEWVVFWIHPFRKRRDIEVRCEAPVLDRRTVSDSGGHRERRLVIQTPLALAGEAWPIEITLTNRDSMLFPMLLGRSAMAERLVVDPSQSYALGRDIGRAFRRSLLKPTRK
ncbi:MAG: ATP-dependent zinc protease [Rhodothermales bacterium]|nr:ATP-dependent zinc protease [Rhodothermales bacterium]